jgi:glucose/arabinose dehydrogenase
LDPFLLRVRVMIERLICRFEHRKKLLGFFVLLNAAVWVAGCYALHPSSGGGQTEFEPPRDVRPENVVLPQGYRIAALATGLTFPTGIVFDDRKRIYVTESGYSYGEVWTIPRLLRIEPDGQFTQIAAGHRNGPWTGVCYHEGYFYVTEGGQLEGGRILRISPQGDITILLDDLPSRGDHHTNAPVIGPDGMLYFAQGTATNSGVVGIDNAQFGWLRRYPHFHDIPCRDILLTGENFSTDNPLQPGSSEKVLTGPYSPFGTATWLGQVVKGRIPCSGSIMRIPPEGGNLELVAWGLRNPFGLAFSPQGRLYASDNQYDVRGSRPVFGSGDLLWEILPDHWYGWPDFHAGQPLYEGPRYQPPGEDPPKAVLLTLPQQPPAPVAIFGVHSSSNGFDFSRHEDFGYVGQAFVAQFGDEAPATGKVLAPVGFKVVRVDIGSGAIEDFAVNRGKTNGPASFLNNGGLERPIAARFDPEGKALWVVDFGVLLHDSKGAIPKKGTGVLWRITRDP